MARKTDKLRVHRIRRPLNVTISGDIFEYVDRGAKRSRSTRSRFVERVLEHGRQSNFS